MDKRRDARYLVGARPSTSLGISARSERTDNRNSVEDPNDPEPNDHEKLKTAQGQPIEPERDIRLNNSWREDRNLRQPDLLIRRGACWNGHRVTQARHPLRPL